MVNVGNLPVDRLHLESWITHLNDIIPPYGADGLFDENGDFTITHAEINIHYGLPKDFELSHLSRITGKMYKKVLEKFKKPDGRRRLPVKAEEDTCKSFRRTLYRAQRPFALQRRQT